MTSTIEEQEVVIMNSEEDLGAHLPLLEAIAKDCAANREELAKVNERLDKTNLNVSNLSFQVAGHQQQLVFLGNDLIDTKNTVKAMDARVLKIESEVSETNERLARLETSTEQRFEQVDRRFEQVDRRFDEVEQRFTRVDGRLDGLESAQRETNTRLDDMNAQLNDVKATQITHGDKLSAILNVVERWGNKAADDEERR